MTPEEKQSFKPVIAQAKESVKEAIRDIEIHPNIDVANLKVLVQHSLRATELLLVLANKSLDDSWRTP